MDDKIPPWEEEGTGTAWGGCEGMVGTQSQWTEMPTSSPHLPEVRGAPLALEAQEPRIQREMVSPHPATLQVASPSDMAQGPAGSCKARGEQNCPACGLPKEG